jgi:hypothetical protein
MTTTTTAALHQVRWRLIPAANDSPVVFLSTIGGVEVPKKSNRVRRLGERVLVAEGDGMWQAGKVATIIELEDGGVAYVVTLKNGRQVWAPADAVNPDPQRPRGAGPTPEQIRQWCLEIQREWPEEVRQQRDMRAQATAWSVPRSHYVRDTQTRRTDFEH